METKRRDPDKDLALNATGNGHPTGLWSDGNTLWVADRVDGKVYAYGLATGSRLPDQDFNTLDRAGNSTPMGLWSDGITMWVADFQDNRVYAYDMTTKRRQPEREFTSSVLNVRWNTSVTGVWSSRSTLWVSDRLGRTDKLYAYDLQNKNRQPTEDFDTLHRGVGHMWSDDTTLWIVGIDRLHAYNLESQNPDPAKDLNGLREAGIDWPQGIWSDGTTMWVAGGGYGSPKLYAYNLANKNRDLAKDIDNLRDAGIDSPNGIWSDGRTIWIANYQDGFRPRPAKLYAYNLVNRRRDPTKDIDTLDAAGNNRPEGLWSDGTTMWVADAADNKLYAYRLPGRPRPFTDPSIVIGETAVAAVHFMELRTRVNALRVRFGLPAFSWTDPTITPRVTPIKAVHINELRMALRQAYGAAGRTLPSYTDEIRAGVTPLKAVHVNELRRRVVALE